MFKNYIHISILTFALIIGIIIMRSLLLCIFNNLNVTTHVLGESPEGRIINIAQKDVLKT